MPLRATRTSFRSSITQLYAFSYPRGGRYSGVHSSLIHDTTAIALSVLFVFSTMPMLMDVAELAGVTVEGPLYGIFLCLFFVCGYDLVQRHIRKQGHLSAPMIVAAVAFLILATGRFILNAVYIFLVFIRHSDTRAQRLAYAYNVDNRVFVARHCLCIATLLIGDSFVIYRCWIVWKKKYWVVVLPLILTFVSTAAGSYSAWTYIGLPGEQEVNETQVHWLKTFFALSLVSNAVSTFLLAYRIWSVDNKVKYATASSLFPDERETSQIMAFGLCVLESGLVNVAFLFASVMCVTFSSAGLEVMCDMTVPLTGITFLIVILRVGYRRNGDAVYNEKTSTFDSRLTPLPMRRNVGRLSNMSPNSPAQKFSIPDFRSRSLHTEDADSVLEKSNGN